MPANLRNGQTFDITAEIETISGQRLVSQPREILLQGENLPANGFTVSLVHPRAGEATFIPKPLEIRAAVNNSSQPVFQVTYLESESVNGPYREIGRHYGPIFVIFRDYGLAESGNFIKLRAVDIFGNTTESQAVQFSRAR